MEENLCSVSVFLLEQQQILEVILLMMESVSRSQTLDVFADLQSSSGVCEENASQSHRYAKFVGITKSEEGRVHALFKSMHKWAFKVFFHVRILQIPFLNWFPNGCSFDNSSSGSLISSYNPKNAYLDKLETLEV